MITLKNQRIHRAREIASTPRSTSLFIHPAAAILMLIAFATMAACASTTTYPETTPVYADDATAGIEPISVERQSTDAPRVNTLTPAKSEPAKSEPAKSEPAKSEPAKSEPVKSEPAKNNGNLTKKMDNSLPAAEQSALKE